MNTFDCDGVITLGIYPGKYDVIITGRSFEEADVTLQYLKEKGITNKVYFNPLKFEEKTRESSGLHKANTLNKLIEQGADTSYDCPQGSVFVQTSQTFQISDGLKSETEVKSKDSSKLNPELLTYFNPDLKLSAKAKKALRNGEDSTLASIVDIVEKEKLVVKIG